VTSGVDLQGESVMALYGRDSHHAHAEGWRGSHPYLYSVAAVGEARVQLQPSLRRAAPRGAAVGGGGAFKHDTGGGRTHFERSLQEARTLGADCEAGLALRAIAETDSSGAPQARAESDRILASLGVVSTPSVPLP
jgi:hypothetical protein